jgi:hypothetical protein
MAWRPAARIVSPDSARENRKQRQKVLSFAETVEMIYRRGRL